ncbi:MAG: amidase [Gemmatimonadota bacterium]
MPARDLPDDDAPSQALDRRQFVRHGMALGVAGTLGRSLAPAPMQRDTVSLDARAPGAPAQFPLEEVTVESLQGSMTTGRLSAVAITQQYLDRIQAIDRTGPSVHAVIEVNPDALAIAARMDAERAAGKVRGPLHGIPILIKDNIDSGDRMHTSAGTLVLAASRAARDAGLVARLRDAGMVLLGKTNLSEWANWRSTRSTSGWSGRGRLTRNPYALDRNACGSSSGTGAAISANLATVGIGTETDGSIVCPAHANGLVGLKPTVGLVSRAGIIPISSTQDTAGPMCRTVKDAAALLSVMAGPDDRDTATAAASSHAAADYTTFCDPDGLRGARIGVVRQLFNAGPAVDAVMREALDAIRDAGAILVDPVAVPTLGKFDAAEHEVLLYESKAGINAYLAALTGDGLPRTLADVIRFNEAHRAESMPYFGQEILLQAQAKGGLESPAYRTALATCQRLARVEGIDRVMRTHRLDALVAPTGGPAWMTDLVNGDHFGGGSSSLAAVAGYPSITVPAGTIFGLPVGISFIVGAWQEGPLVRYAYAFERATHARRAPRFLATVELDP